MFRLLRDQTLPLATEKPVRRNEIDDDLIEDSFVELYGTKSKSRARKLYRQQPLTDIGYQLLYTLPEKEKIYHANEESAKKAQYFRAFHALFEKVQTTAAYLETQTGWFGDKTLYLIGKTFLTDVASAIETHFSSLTQPQSAYLSEKSFTHYIQLSLLRKSPTAFMQSQQNTALIKHTEDVTRIKQALWAASKNPQKIDIAELDALSRRVENIEKAIADKPLTDAIQRLENSWSRFFFGWYTGENKTLADLKQLQSTKSIITEHTAQLTREIAAQHKIELAKHRYLAINEKLLDNPDQLTNKDLMTWEENVAILVAHKPLFTSLIQPNITALENRMKLNLHELLKTTSAWSDENIVRGIAMQFSALLSQDIRFNSQKKIADYINQLIASIQMPSTGQGFCQALLTFITPKNAPGIAATLQANREQFRAWGIVKSALETGQTATTDETYQALVTLFDSNMTAHMQADVSRFTTQYTADLKQRMTQLLNAELSKPTAEIKATISVLKQKLLLLSLEKIQLLNPEQAAILKETRNELISLLTEHIRNLPSAAKLDIFSATLEDIWPNGILPTYIRIKNNGQTPFTWPMTQQSDTLPYSITCHPQENRDKIKLYKPSISDITLQPEEERLIYFVPRLAESSLKDAIIEKRNTLLAALNTQETFDQAADINELAFLKNNEPGAFAAYWKKLFGQHNTSLDPITLITYGDALIERIYELYNKADSLTCSGYPVEASWIMSDLRNEIELIARAFDLKLQALLSTDDLKKTAASLKTTIDPIDLGHLLLQWRFVNLFNRGNVYQPAVSPHTGTSILHKMCLIVKEEPNFIHHFLGSMNEAQLDLLESTFTYDAILRVKQLPDQPNSTQIKHSTLLHQMSALIQQELVAYLNGDTVNMPLFEEHINFVLKRFEWQTMQAQCLQNGNLANELRDELQKGMTWLKQQKIDAHLLSILTEQETNLMGNTDIVAYLKQFPQEIIQHLPAELADFISKAQYQYADIKTSLKQILSDKNITQPSDYAKIRELKYSSLYTLVDMIIRDEKEVCRLFGTEQYHPVVIPKTNWGLLPTLSSCYNVPKQCVGYLYNNASSALNVLSYFNWYGKKRSAENTSANQTQATSHAAPKT